MRTVTILKVGHQHFLMPSGAAAAKAIVALADAVPLRWHFTDRQEYYTLERDRDGIGMTQVSADAVRLSEPRQANGQLALPERTEV